MRILSTVSKHYYRRPEAIEPMYLEFTLPLAKLGHAVDHFDHINTRAQSGPEVCGEQFVQQVKNGGYDVVLYQTAGQDWMVREAIGDAARSAPVIAWNSDDDWQWESYTSQVARHFTFMVTTYPQVYEPNARQYPNLLLSQWGCLDTYADHTRPKDLDFTFAGQMYGSRGQECAYLRRVAGLKVYGLGAARVNHPWLYLRGLRRITRRLPVVGERAILFKDVNDIWNRSKVSYTPMGASVDPKLLSIKSRTFEMGLSGTLMLCQHSPHLERYYEPGKEFVPFHDLDDCAEKAKYYIRHDSERDRIAEAYRRRTGAEHMWEHRFRQLFRDAGLPKA
jgi:spore maturation protein CgeB